MSLDGTEVAGEREAAGLGRSGEISERAIAQGEHAIAAACEAEMVGDEDGGQAMLALEALEQAEDGLGRGLVEIAGGLVGEQDGGFGDEGARERDALLLAARELARAMPGAIGEADGGEPGQRRTARCCGGRPAGEQRHGDVFGGGELREQVVELPEVADLAVAEGGGGGA